MLKKLFSVNSIILYVLMFMISMSSFLDNVSVFAMAGVAAAVSVGVPVAPIAIVCGLGTFIGFGQVRYSFIHIRFFIIYCDSFNIKA